ncbi:hypothetical protein GCM10009618_02680 [Nesterenkonia lacusekhoensis]
MVADPGAVEGDLRGRNLRLMMAYTVHKRGLCPKCGYPRSVCRSGGSFQAQREVCHASAVVEEKQEQAQKSSIPDHGVMWMPVKQSAATDMDPDVINLPPGMFD